jgi:hypothetical protein
MRVQTSREPRKERTRNGVVTKEKVNWVTKKETTS